MSNARVSRRARRWAYANRPYESIDSPVKKYLRGRSGPKAGLQTKGFRRILGSRMLRPAF